MQGISANSFSLASAPASAGAVPQLLGKQGEMAASATFAPVDEVSLTYEVATEDYYSPVQRRLARKADEAAKADAQVTEESQAADDEAAAAQAELALLKQRDKKVKAHEQAHSSVGGAFTGTASFSYETGSDGVLYAVDGEVQADLSDVAGDPAATVSKMEQVQRAALAPAEPSLQDRQVAAQAGQQAAAAMSQLAAEHSAVQKEEIARLEAEKADVKAEMAAARKEQEDAEEKEADEKAVSAAERFAEYNAKLRRINEVLLRISLPAPVSAGQILDDMA